MIKNINSIYFTEKKKLMNCFANAQQVDTGLKNTQIIEQVFLLNIR